MGSINKLRNKVILVTGGGTGIGRAIALEFAKRNAFVIINYSKSGNEADHTLKEVKRIGSDAIKIKTDITKNDEVKKMFALIKKKVGRLDVMVNNAGWSKFVNYNDLGKISEKMYQRVMDVNFKGVFLCSREAVKLMRGVKDALIINISSVSGLNGMGSNIIYCAAKGAVITMTKSLALALGPRIRVNSIAPGFTNTRFISKIPKSILKEEIKRTFLRRIAEPEDIAKVAVALYEEMKFINGQTIIVDGGRCRLD